jgi:hypothetical protein
MIQAPNTDIAPAMAALAEMQEKSHALSDGNLDNSDADPSDPG